MRFAQLVESYERIAATTKRLEMTDHLVALFREVPKDAIDQVVYLTRGRVAPDYAGVELGLAEKLAIRAMYFASLGSASVRRAARRRIFRS